MWKTMCLIGGAGRTRSRSPRPGRPEEEFQLHARGSDRFRHGDGADKSGQAGRGEDRTGPTNHVGEIGHFSNGSGGIEVLREADAVF